MMGSGKLHPVGSHLCSWLHFLTSIKWGQLSSQWVLGWTKVHPSKWAPGNDQHVWLPSPALCTFHPVWTWIISYYLLRSCFPGRLRSSRRECRYWAFLPSPVFSIRHCKKIYWQCWWRNCPYYTHPIRIPRCDIIEKKATNKNLKEKNEEELTYSKERAPNPAQA